MAQDKEFWDRVYARMAEKRQRLAAICAEHDLPYVFGNDLYDTCWNWEYNARQGRDFPTLPAELREWLIDDANRFGEGLYDKEQLKAMEDRSLAGAYTECAAAYAQGQM